METQNQTLGSLEQSENVAHFANEAQVALSAAARAARPIAQSQAETVLTEDGLPVQADHLPVFSIAHANGKVEYKTPEKEHADEMNADKPLTREAIARHFGHSVLPTHLRGNL